MAGQPFPISFYVDDASEPWHEDSELAKPPAIGDGVLAPSGVRYRVVDSWFSFDHHGQFDVGYHVFLQPVEEGSEDDRLARLAPQYFTKRGDVL